MAKVAAAPVVADQEGRDDRTRRKLVQLFDVFLTSAPADSNFGYIMKLLKGPARPLVMSRIMALGPTELEGIRALGKEISE